MAERIGELLVWDRAIRSEADDAEVPGRPIIRGTQVNG